MNPLHNLNIGPPAAGEIRQIHRVFELAIRDAFKQEGLEAHLEDIKYEISHKQERLANALYTQEPALHFLVARVRDEVVGTISYGPSGQLISECTDGQLKDVGELGSLYILPDYQNRGIGSALISEMVQQLDKQGIEQFCLDSGYRRAQVRWARKFGPPYAIAKDRWGPDSPHMVWLCQVQDWIQ